MANERTARQIRSCSQQFTTREAADDLYIEGYFAVFNSEYPLWEGASEIVKPGAFDTSVSGDVRALINHNTTLVLGRTKSGTLTFFSAACRLIARSSGVSPLRAMPSGAASVPSHSAFIYLR